MVFFGSNSMKSIDLMQRGMNAAVKRGEVINNNIANATTPHYKRQDITFQSELQRALNSEKEYPGPPMKLSDKRHIPAFRVKDYREVRPKKVVDFNSIHNNDGNSVDIDKEMLEASKNTLYFNALAQRTAKEFTKLKYIIRS